MFINTKLSLSGVLLVLLCCGKVCAEVDVSQLQQLMSSQMNRTDEVKALVKDKCIQVAGEIKGTEAYNELETSGPKLVECLSGLINITAVPAEIAEASPRGDLDVVFNKYCKKRTDAVECVENFNSKLVPCLEKEEVENLNLLLSALRTVLNFVCHKDGDHIALFIAENGPECLQEKSGDIQQCLTTTFGEYIPQNSIDDIKITLPKLVFGKKFCDNFLSVEKCVVEKLETCKDSTPANMVDSMFRFVKNELYDKACNHK